MENFKITPFDPSRIKPTATVQFIGKRGSGKSTLINDVLYHNRDKFRYGIGMSPTDEATKGMSSIMPRSSVYSNFSKEAIERMLDTQRVAVNRHPDRNNNMFLIMDDCAFDKKTFSSTTIREVFMNGRHRKIFYVNSVQYMMDMPSFLRGQIDYVFAMQDNQHDNKERLWKYFFGIFPDYKSFNTVFENCTNDFGCLVMDTTVRSNKIEDCIFWYRADPNLPKFKLCAEIFWKLDEKYFVDDLQRDEPEHDEEHGVMVVKVPK